MSHSRVRLLLHAQLMDEAYMRMLFAMMARVPRTDEPVMLPSLLPFSITRLYILRKKLFDVFDALLLLLFLAHHA